MCGIAGIWGSDDRAALGAMVGALYHRGPDDVGTFFDTRVGLGMTRLAIIDTTSGGHQPMQTPDAQITVVYNGELYNFRSERDLLEKKGFEFRSTSDTEVVLRMYEHYGDDFLLRMRGMFALAVYDKRRGPGKERLLLARDQMGIKPLLYARIGDRLIFASELKALLASGLIPPEVDPDSLRLLLTYGSVYQPRTILRGVKMLPAAHYLVLQGGNERVERYWSLGIDRCGGLRSRPYEEQLHEVGAALEESVRLQMVSDVPLGAFLSGGLDSSLLVALMARQVGGKQVKTFSVGFEAEGREMDETDDAEVVARFIGTDHRRVVVTGEEVRRRIEHIVYALDQPSVDGVNSYFVSLAARQAVTVAISGTGGDELFAGYRWFAEMALDETRWRAQPQWKTLARMAAAPAVRMALLDSLPSARMRQRIRQLRYTTDFRTRYTGNCFVFGPERWSRLLAPDFRAQAPINSSVSDDLSSIDELADGSVIERVTGICLRGYTTNQLLRDIDAVSMAHSLEVRVPYLDPMIADIALSLPDDAKLGTVHAPTVGPAEQTRYRDSGAKRILLDVGARMLPPNFDSRPKRGFGMPFVSWLRGPLKEVADDAFGKHGLGSRGIFNATEVANIREEFLEGRSGWIEVWLLMILELWLRGLGRQEFSDSLNLGLHAKANLTSNSIVVHSGV